MDYGAQVRRRSYKMQKTHPGVGSAVETPCPYPVPTRANVCGCGCGAPNCIVCGWPKHCSLHMGCIPDVDGRPWDHEYTPSNALS